MATKDGMVFLEACRGIYGLPQAGIEKQFNEYKYYQSTMMPGLWKHKTQSTQFALVVDNFDVNCIMMMKCNTSLLQSLPDPLIGKPLFEMSLDLARKQFISLTMNWDYTNRKVHISMPENVEKSFKCFKHNKLTKPNINCILG